VGRRAVVGRHLAAAPALYRPQRLLGFHRWPCRRAASVVSSSYVWATALWPGYKFHFNSCVQNNLLGDNKSERTVNVCVYMVHGSEPVE
jgi:hypothetical protein